MVHALFNLVFLHWLSGQVNLREPFRKEFFISCSSIALLDVFLIGFQSQVFWGLIFAVQDRGVEMPDVELKSVTH